MQVGQSWVGYVHNQQDLEALVLSQILRDVVLRLKYLQRPSQHAESLSIAVANSGIYSALFTPCVHSPSLIPTQIPKAAL